MRSGDDIEVDYMGAKVRIGLDPIEWVIIAFACLVALWLWLR